MPPKKSSVKHNPHKGARQTFLNRTKFDPTRYKVEGKPSENVVQWMTSLCCYRCSLKLRWKGDYGKYRTSDKPRRCNGCKNTCVTIAYHHLCQSCARGLAVCAKCQLPAAVSEEKALYERGVARIDSEGDDSEEQEEEESADGPPEDPNATIPLEFKCSSDEPDEELRRLAGLDTSRIRAAKKSKEAHDAATARCALRERERRALDRQVKKESGNKDGAESIESMDDDEEVL